MRDRKAIQAAAALVTVGAVTAMLLVARGGAGADMNPALPRAAGAELARQTLSRLKPGGQITVITRDTTAFPNPATDCLLQGFERELRRAHTGISAIQRLQVDPLRIIGVPSGDFQEWIHHAAVGDVIVSFLGPPVLTPEQRRQLGPIRPAIVAFCPGNWPDRLDFRALFAQDLLRAAILSRRNSSPALAGAQSFDRLYAVVTAANAEDFVFGDEKPGTSKSP